MSRKDVAYDMPDSPILQQGEDAILRLGTTHGGREIWMNRSGMARHTFVLGSTGSGKTEMLLGMAANSIASGNGLLLVDGKGDISTFARVYAVAHRFGRAADVLLVNFSRPISPGEAHSGFLSHTLNPLLDLSSDSIVQMLTSLMEQGGKEHEMWKGRAVSLVIAVSRALVWLRDTGREPLTMESMRDAFNLRRVVDLASAEYYPDMPENVRNVIAAYLKSLPGYTAEKHERQAQTTLDQHGYLTMQLTRLFSSLVDVYGHIFSTGTSNVDMRDVVVNRRILVVMLPVLEKSPEEVASLGRIVVALLRNMMASAMQSPVQGDWEDITSRRSTNAEYPFMCILDEVSQYMTSGLATMAGQARSLGFSMVFASQDLGMMERVDKAETGSILANTNLKLLMRTASADDLKGRGILPSRHDERSVEHKNRDQEILCRIEALSDKVSYGERIGLSGEEIRAAMLELLGTRNERVVHAQSTQLMDLSQTVSALQPGEFMAIQDGHFLLGNALNVGSCIGKPDIALVHPVPWNENPADIRRGYEDRARRKALPAMLVADPAALLGRIPVNWAGAWTARQPGVKSSIRRSFAVMAHIDAVQKPDDKLIEDFISTLLSSDE